MKGQTGVGVWWAGGERVERSRETEEARRGGRAVPVKPKPGSVNYEIGRVVYGRGPRCMQFLVSSADLLVHHTHSIIKTLLTFYKLYGYTNTQR